MPFGYSLRKEDGTGIQVQPLGARHVEEMDRGAFATDDGEADGGADGTAPLRGATWDRAADCRPRITAPFVDRLSCDPLTQDGGLCPIRDVPAMARRAATFVDKILKGARPGGLPVEQPTKFEAGHQPQDGPGARSEVPSMLLAIADEVIE